MRESEMMACLVTLLRPDTAHCSRPVLAATHVHQDHRNCLEIVIMKGTSADVQRLADQMLSRRGVERGKLVLTSTVTTERK